MDLAPIIARAPLKPMFGRSLYKVLEGIEGGVKEKTYSRRACDMMGFFYPAGGSDPPLSYHHAHQH